MCTETKQVTTHHMVKHMSNNTRRSPNVVLMLCQRRRRWPNIKTTLGQCLVYTCYSTNTRRCSNVALLLCQRRKRWHNIKTTLGQCFVDTCYSTNTRRCSNVAIMLCQRRRRWNYIKSTLNQRLVLLMKRWLMVFAWWASVADGGPALSQHCTSCLLCKVALLYLMDLTP